MIIQTPTQRGHWTELETDDLLKLLQATITASEPFKLPTSWLKAHWLEWAQYSVMSEKKELKPVLPIEY